jgi:WD40 repeat protein
MEKEGTAMREGTCAGISIIALILSATISSPQSDRPELLLQIGHSAQVFSVAFSPDGKKLASGSMDNTVILWDLATGKPEKILKGHTGWVLSVAFSPDGRKLASGSRDNTVILWDINSGRAEKILKGHTSIVFSVAFSPDGKKLASGSWDETVILWDIDSGKVEKILKDHKGNVNSVAFSPDGRKLASGSADNTVILWDLATGKAEKILKGHTEQVWVVAFSPDGRKLASVSWDRTVILWDLDNGRAEKKLKGTVAVLSIAFSPDGKKLALGLSDNMVILWDLGSGKAEKILKGHASSVRSVSFSPDGRKLASGSADNTVILWDLATGKAEKILGHISFVLSVAFSPDGKNLASGSEDKTIVLWDLDGGRAEKMLKEHKDAIFSVAFSPNGRKLASGSRDNTVILWNLDSERVEKILKGHTDSVLSVAFSPDSKKLASGSSDNMVILWDLDSGRVEKILKGHTGWVLSVAFSPDGKKLASGSWDETVILWDIDSGKVEKILKGHRGNVKSVAFSPNGRKLASGSSDYTVILWDINSGKAEKIFRHTTAVQSVAFSPDGRKLASGLVDNTLILWDLATGEPEKILKGHTSYITSIAFSPDGRKLASGSADGSVKVWDVETGRELVTLLSLDGGQDWLITTPEGYYDGSPNGANLVAWKLGGEIYPAERFEEQFKRPDFVARALKGEPLPANAPILTTRKVPPMAQILAPIDGTIVEGETVQVEVLGMDDEKVTDLELFVNGRPISPAIRRGIALVGDKPVDEGRYKSAVTFRLTVPLPPGAERIRIMAIVYDNERLKSNPAEVTVFRRLAAGEVTEKELYVLSIGVSRYKNLPREGQLQFAHKDAMAVAEFFKQQEGRLFRRVHVYLLVDEQATKQAIQSILFELIEKVKRSDTVVLFFAGHGLRDEDFNYYFAPYELDLGDIKGTGVATDVFERALSKIDAEQIFAFFDTCHSGGVLGELQVGTERLVERLMKKSGVTVFCSSTGEEVSFEREDWGHGAFTLALLEGLKGEADRLPQDSYVTLAELQAFVSSRVSKLTEGRQNPRIPLQVGGDPNTRLAMIK